MSVSPQPSPASPSNPGRPQKDGGAAFGATPIWAFATAAIATIGGAATYVLTANATVAAMCGGQRMRPGDICETTRNGVRTGTETYAEVLADAMRTNQVAQWVGLALVVIGVALALMTYLRWRQDVAMKQQLSNALGTPLSAHSRTTSSSLLGLVFGAGFLGVAVFLLLTGMARSQPGYYVGTALCGGLGLLILSAAIPKNGQLIETFEQGVRVVARNEEHTWAWRDVDYTITPAKGAANHSIGGPGLKSIPLTGLQGANELQSLAQQRSVQAKLGPAIEAVNRGETVTFGALGVSREGIVAGRKVLPWHEYGGITLHQGNVGIVKAPKGRFTGVSLGSVPNYALLVNLIGNLVTQRPQQGQSV